LKIRNNFENWAIFENWVYKDQNSETVEGGGGEEEETEEEDEGDL
jgi:hypothetical protein